MRVCSRVVENSRVQCALRRTQYGERAAGDLCLNIKTIRAQSIDLFSALCSLKKKTWHRNFKKIILEMESI